MTTTPIKEILLWYVILNYVVLLVWAGTFVFARNWMYRWHSRWFKLSNDTFDAMHYGGLAVYKIGIFLFGLMPLLALYLAT